MKLGGKDLKLKPPNLKLSRGTGGELKAPQFLTDLYQDLRDRRLLPFVVVLLVAIVAVPFVLSEDPEGLSEPPVGESVVSALREASESSSDLTVVRATPGLRDYRERLSSRKPTDPFEQRYTSPMLKGSALNGQSSESTTKGGSKEGEGESTSTTTSGGGGESGGGGGGSSPGGSGGKGTSGEGGGSSEVTLYGFAIDLRIVRNSGSAADGDKRTAKPVVRHRVLPPAPLPGKNSEVVTYIGVSPKTRKPLFLISTEVTGVFGDGVCAAGTDVCQLIELERGIPETFVDGDSGNRFKITVLSMEAVPVGHP